MEQNDFILVIDSGNGGEYTLKQLQKQLPTENFIFFKDEKNAPYGNKSKKQLQNITKHNLKILLSKYKVKAVVFACNTLSVVVLKQIKKYLKNIKMIGVFPPIKKALSKNKRVLVLSTFATLNIGKIDKNYKDNKNVSFVGFKDLAKMIDENINNLDNLLTFLQKNLNIYSNIQNVVLGCTHFNLIKHQLRIVLNNKKLKFYEGSKLTTKRLKNYLIKKDLCNKSHKSGKVIKLNYL